MRERGPMPDMMEGIIPIRRFVIPCSQFLMFWMLSICYRLALEWLSTNRKNKEIETEKSTIELAYLKAQINPHFIFNTLNTIYSLTINKSEKATDALLLYSQTVRYVLDKLDTNFVRLKEEIDYITCYIDLQTLRFTNSLNVEFETKGDIEEHVVAPLVFISFIENAFQYGISNNYPSTISISISASHRGIHFVSKNKKYKNNEFQHVGKNIGIQNAQRKLNLMYPNKHKLEISEVENFFIVDLLIYNTRIINQ